MTELSGLNKGLDQIIDLAALGKDLPPTERARLSEAAAKLALLLAGSSARENAHLIGEKFDEGNNEER